MTLPFVPLAGDAMKAGEARGLIWYVGGGEFAEARPTDNNLKSVVSGSAMSSDAVTNLLNKAKSNGEWID